MRAIRLGNDIYITWTITGLSNVSGTKVIKLFNTNKSAPETITYSISGNVVSAVYKGKDQVAQGVYRMLLQVNNGADDMVTLDKVNAFSLHDVCDFGIMTGTDENGVETVTVDLQSDITVSTQPGFEQKQADWNETDTDDPAYIKNKPTIPAAQEQADWNETDTDDPAYIKNKPTIPAAQEQADWNETDTDDPAYIKNKPSIPAAQVQANWNEADTDDPAYIKNKPTIPAAQIQADWNQSSSSAADFIKNKPTIPAAQEQADWNESDSNDPAYIKNKPTIPAAQVQADWNQSSSSAADFIKNKPTIPDVSNKEDVTPIVAQSTAISTLTAEVGKYYRLDVAVETLAITLPTMTGVTNVKTITFYMTGGTTPGVTFTSTHNVYLADFTIESGKTYEVNAAWNGASWIVAAVNIIIPSV